MNLHRRQHSRWQQRQFSTKSQWVILLSILRERVLKEVDPSTVGNMPTDVLEHKLEVIIHEIANKDKLELSGGEQARLAKELANDMTGYGPLQALLLDDSVNDIMVNGPNKVYVERRGKLERVAIRFSAITRI